MIIPPSGQEPADEWARLGVEAQMAQKFPDAERYYRRALTLDPGHALATQNLAVLFAQTNQNAEALLAIERAALMDGVMPLIHVNRAYMNLEADRIDDALEAARHAVGVSTKSDLPGHVNSRLALAMISATAGRPQDALPLYAEMLEAEPTHPVANPNICFVQTLCGVGPEELLKQRQRWRGANCGPNGLATIVPANDRDPDRTLRVGYVGGDFKRHSAAMIFGSVVLDHDPAQVEVYLYSSLPVDPKADDVTRRFQQKAHAGNIRQSLDGAALVRDFDHWRDIQNVSDDDAAAMIRKDRIDILVDLAGHTNGGRLAVFLRRPAPVQVTAWGFAHGTGLPEIDYFFADPVAVPTEERRHYAEKVYDLPCIVSYLPPDEYGLKGVSPPPHRRNDGATFGCFARFEKLSDDFLVACAEILKRVPGSRLVFKDHAFRRPYSIRRVRAAMGGVESSRLLFGISSTHPEHLAAVQNCDLILDPWPHGGGVVTLETLWMGVPLITVYGAQPSGRTASSVLTAMGRGDWIAQDRAEYVTRAVALANDLVTLSQVRKTLRQELLDSPVIKGYRAAVEAAYREMWKEYCRR